MKMGLFNRRSSRAAPASTVPQANKQDDTTHGEVAAGNKVVMEKENITILACLLGAVASLGGFIFGYVRYAAIVAGHSYASKSNHYF